VFCHQWALSHNAEPYHAHFPHPESAWAYAVAQVEVAGPPTNPEGGESVVEVPQLPAADAAEWLRVHDEEHADVVRLADALGRLTP
jgi:8-oxo-dGTP diphosphatase